MFLWGSVLFLPSRIVIVSRGNLLCSFHCFSRLFGPRSGPLASCAALSLCNSEHGILLGCRSALDRVSDKKNFFLRCSNKKLARCEEGLHRLFGSPIAIDRAWSNQSEGALDVCQSWERRDKFSPKPPRHFDPIFYSKFKIWNNSFQWETSNFLWPRKNQHFGGEGITAKLPSHCTSWGIYKHAPTAFWRKRRLLYWKKGGHKKRFSQGGYMQGTSSPP